VNILLLSRYERLGASSRYRSYQYLPHLRSRGHAITVSPLLSDNYLRRLYARQAPPLWDLCRSYVRRIRALLQSSRFDLLWIEYEALPWFPYVAERLIRPAGIPYVVDYDDAVFHRYDMHRVGLVRRSLGSKIDRVMRDAAVVIAGNDYLAERAIAAGAQRTEIIPTVIDVSRYPGIPPADRHPFRIGWIGSPSTSHFLRQIEPALQEVCAGTDARLTVIGDSHVLLQGVPVDSVTWNEATEIDELARCDVGIMPLTDNPWERGKCGLKLVKYMGCSLPVVASPVGINRSIVEEGVNGFLAENSRQWVEALSRFRQDYSLRRNCGLAGRAKVEAQYSLQHAAPRLAAILEHSRSSR